MTLSDAAGFRKADNDYFNYLFCVSPRRAQVSPIIVIRDTKVAAYTHWGTLFEAKMPDNTLILHAWPGEWRTDVFAYSFGEFKKRAKRY